MNNLKTEYKCLECALSGLIHLLDKQVVSKEKKDDVLRFFFSYMSEADYELSAPYIARDIHAVLRDKLKCKDLYADAKKKDNDKVLKMLPELKEVVYKSKDPVRSALMLSVAGNVIDLGTDHGLDHSLVITNALTRDLSIDNFSELISNIKSSLGFIYLCDNTGEIVFDKLFLDVLCEQGILEKNKVTIAVRGAPILNDATIEDAEYIGLTKNYRVISNGDCAPGTCLEYTSKEFNEAFKSADFVISKGQGNFESLSNHREKKVFFMLIAKCSLVADQLGVGLGDMVCEMHG